MARRDKASASDAVKREARRDLVMRYALGGATHGRIADLLAEHHGITVNRSTICRDVLARLESAAKDCPATADYRELHRQRLEALIETLWGTAIAGDLVAIRRLVTVMDRQAKLLGLDMPVKIAATDPDGNAAPAVDFAAIIARFQAAVEDSGSE